MVKSDGTAVEAAENMYPTIGIPHTMIKHCSAHLNGTLLYPQSDTYPYRWYINTLLDYTQTSQEPFYAPRVGFREILLHALPPSMSLLRSRRTN